MARSKKRSIKGLHSDEFKSRLKSLANAEGVETDLPRKLGTSKVYFNGERVYLDKLSADEKPKNLKDFKKALTKDVENFDPSKTKDAVWERFISGATQTGFLEATDNVLRFFASPDYENSSTTDNLILNTSSEFWIKQDGEDLLVTEVVHINNVVKAEEAPDADTPQAVAYRLRQATQKVLNDPEKYSKIPDHLKYARMYLEETEGAVATLATTYSIKAKPKATKVDVDVIDTKISIKNKADASFLPDKRTFFQKIKDFVKNLLGKSNKAEKDESAIVEEGESKTFPSKPSR